MTTPKILLLTLILYLFLHWQYEFNVTVYNKSYVIMSSVSTCDNYIILSWSTEAIMYQYVLYSFCE